MKAVTIRGVDPEIAEKLKSIAAKQSKSVNQLLLEFIKKIWALKKKKNIHVNTMILTIFLERGRQKNMRTFRERSATNVRSIRNFGIEKSID